MRQKIDPWPIISYNLFMEIKTWDVPHMFQPSLAGENIQMVGIDLPKPKGLDERIRGSWLQQLQKKQQELGSDFEIRPYHQDKSSKPLEALYEGDSPKMWPGPVVTLREVERELLNGRNRLTLKVGQMFYPYIAALKEPEVRELYDKEGLIVPSPALGICTPVLTADNKLTLTVRGSKTSIYASRIHSPGGQPLFTDTDVAEHQIDEISEEVLIGRNELEGGFSFTGIVLDQEVYPGKPDLTGFVKTSLDKGDIRERFLKTDPAKRPTDVAGLVFAAASEDGLMKYMTESTHPLNFCPPTVGSLWLFGRLMYGQDWAKDLLSKLGYA